MTSEPASDEKKVSVIVPVYNGSGHIGRCIESVLAQEDFPLHDLELVLLDDGSTDDSLAVLHRHERDNPGVIRVLQHANRGAAETRNRGILEAGGTYVMFIDQDDWINPDYCRTFVDAIEATGADVVYGGYSRPTRSGTTAKLECPSSAFYSRFIVTAAWAKIHSRRLLLDHSISFFGNRFGEDSVFTIKEIAATPRWHRIDYVGYNWYLNEASVSNTAQRGLSAQSTTDIVTLLDELLVAGAPLRDRHEFRYYLMRTIVFYLLFSGRASDPSDFLHAHRTFFAWYRTNCGALSPVALRGPKGETATARFAIALLVLVDRLGLTPAFARLYCRRR